MSDDCKPSALAPAYDPGRGPTPDEIARIIWDERERWNGQPAKNTAETWGFKAAVRIVELYALSLSTSPAPQPVEREPQTVEGIEIDYTNYRGERAWRTIVPTRVWFGSTEYHLGQQWLLKAYDLTKKDYRDFALKDIHAFGRASLAVPVEAWRAIDDEAKDKLVDIWITRLDGTGTRWADCYYDQICDEWRTSRPSGHLISIKAKFVTHYRARPLPPGSV